MRLDISDLLLFIGCGLIVYGLYLYDYRLAIISGGIVFSFTGFVRLWYNHSV